MKQKKLIQEKQKNPNKKSLHKKKQSVKFILNL